MRDNGDLKTRKVTVEVKGVKITFDEYYKIDPKTGEEVFDRNIEIINDSNLYDLYKKKVGLLTISEIKRIRKKYNMNQKEYAMALGVGEVTINRFENGAIQTEATDAIMRLSENPNNMYALINNNKKNIPDELYNIFIKRVSELMYYETHKIANIDDKIFYNMDFKTEDVNDVSNILIKKYNKQYELINKKYNIETDDEFITPLKLQKLLYYIQGLSLHIYGKPAFENKIIAWNYGPVVEEVYKKYNGKNPIVTPKQTKKISKGLECIIDIVINDYGKYSANSLINLTHDETPWKETKKNQEIMQDEIKRYFDKVYFVY